MFQQADLAGFPVSFPIQPQAAQQLSGRREYRAPQALAQGPFRPAIIKGHRQGIVADGVRLAGVRLLQQEFKDLFQPDYIGCVAIDIGKSRDRLDPGARWWFQFPEYGLVEFDQATGVVNNQEVELVDILGMTNVFFEL